MNNEIIKYASVILISIIYMFCKELEEESHYSTFKGKYAKWLNNRTSWINKWKIDEKGRPVKYVSKWYHFGIKHRYAERFPLSSTLLVGFTDGEHFFQLSQLICITLIISISNSIHALLFIIGIIILGILKETIFNKLIK
jgi:hypothetical protein